MNVKFYILTGLKGLYYLKIMFTLAQKLTTNQTIIHSKKVNL